MDEQSPRRMQLHPSLSGFLSLLAVALVALLFFAVVGTADAQYGMAAFCGIPFFVGFASALITSSRGLITFKQCAAGGLYAVAMVAAGVIIFRWEGFVCVLMAAPIVIPLVLLGSWAGYGVRRHYAEKKASGGVGGKLSVAVGMGFFPLLLSKEIVEPPQFAEHIETTEMVINGSPEQIWPLVCGLDKLPPPTEILFRAGIAYPTEILCPQPTLGGNRICRLSTGDMPERIAIFEPNRRFVFDVLSTPPTMKETSPYGELKTRHLKGYYLCRRGEFDLIPMGKGRTKLVGTSWYANRIAPDIYWAFWTQTIVEQVHVRVMSEIKRRAEKESNDSGRTTSYR